MVVYCVVVVACVVVVDVVVVVVGWFSRAAARAESGPMYKLQIPLAARASDKDEGPASTNTVHPSVAANVYCTIFHVLSGAVCKGMFPTKS